MSKFMRILATLALVACIGSACSTGNNPIPSPTGLLYVLDRINRAVYVYDNVDTLDGALDPVRSLSGSNTLIQNPTAIAVDTRRDALFVAETTGEQVLVFIPASESEGDIAPRRTYPGLNRAAALFYDLDNDRLYAADAIDQSVQVWDKISQIPSGTGPGRRIGLGYEPSSLFVDTQRDRLYVGDPAAGAVKAYANASTLGVNNPPVDASIQDSSQAFVDLDSLTMNVPNNILFVAEGFNPSVEIFDAASTLDGSVPTDRNLEGGSTGLTLDMGQAIFLENVLYVALSRTQIGIWDSANQLTGDVAPNRQLTVNPAQQILGIAVDLAH